MSPDRHRLPRSRRLMVERLESRAMLAGNVTVAVTDGALRIQGDALGNDIEIQQLQRTFFSDWPGAILEIKGHSTTINGGTSSFLARGVKNGASIFLGNGDNNLRIGDPPTGTKQVVLAGLVQIGTWKGQDNIRMTIKNGSNVLLDTGPRNDRITLPRCDLNRLTVNSDPIPAEGEQPVGGPDDIFFRAVTARGLVSIDTGNGDDVVDIKENCSFNGGFAVDLGERFSQFNLLTVTGGTFNGTTTITGGDERDKVEFFSITSTGTFTVSLGGADDLATLRECRIAETTLDGGAGFDTLTRLGTNELGELTIVNFEKQE